MVSWLFEQIDCFRIKLSAFSSDVHINQNEERIQHACSGVETYDGCQPGIIGLIPACHHIDEARPGNDGINENEISAQELEIQCPACLF